jgi:hypothetical protein
MLFQSKLLPESGVISGIDRLQEFEQETVF